MAKKFNLFRNHYTTNTSFEPNSFKSSNFNDSFDDDLNYYDFEDNLSLSEEINYQDDLIDFYYDIDDYDYIE